MINEVNNNPNSKVCPTCGTPNPQNAVFCSSCGNAFPVKKKGKTKLLLIIIGSLLLIAIIALVAFILIRKFTKLEDPFDDIDTLVEDNIGYEDEEDSPENYEKPVINSLTNKLNEDLSTDSITKNDYVKELAYAFYDKTKLDNKYQNFDTSMYEVEDLLDQVELYFDDLDDETLMYIYNKLCLNDYSWPEETNSTPQASTSPNYETLPLAKEDGNIKTLDKALLSRNKHFIVYYASKGTNATDQAYAQSVADMLENTIEAYQNKFNLSFKYDATLYSSSIPLDLNALLFLNGIDAKYVYSAMPVYIVDNANSDALAWYLPDSGLVLDIAERVFINLNFDEEFDNPLMRTFKTTYAFPYIAITNQAKDFEDLNFMAAHELFHHYQRYLCGTNGKYETFCDAGDFTVETLASYAASQAFEATSSSLTANNHFAYWVAHTEESIDTAGSPVDGQGYPPYPFLYNYAQIVPNGHQILFDSLKHENALEYLASNSKYKDVLIETTIKNLVQDYDNKLYIPYNYVADKTYIPPNYDDITASGDLKTNTINYSSMHYYYLKPNYYSSGSQLTFEGNENLSLLIFVKEQDGYKHIYTTDLKGEFVLNMDDFTYYNKIVIALVNYSATKNSKYSYSMVENGPKEPSVTSQDLNIPTLDEVLNNYNSFTCYEIEDSSDYKTVTQVQVGFDSQNKINNLFYKLTIKLNEYDPDDPTFQITKRLAKLALGAVQKIFEEQLKDFKINTSETEDSLSVLFKVNKNFYYAISNDHELDNASKSKIIQYFESQGLKCKHN